MIVLLAQNQFPTEQVANALLMEGVRTSHYQWEHTLRELTLPYKPEKVVLIALTPNIAGVGDRTREARTLFGGTTHLVVCTLSLAERERTALNESGANTIVSPRTISIEHVSERITAELMLGGNGESISFGSLHGGSKQMRTLYGEIEKLAGLNDPILILGETGTGKDLIAAEIHRRSKRPEPFLKLNCAEFSPELLRAELFGFKKGSFTGATHDKQGLLAEAGGGTLFLNEIGELDGQAQAMLLQALEDRRYRPVGSNKTQAFGARLLLATHRNLEQMVEQGKFRQDLYARISDFILHAPPLRDRRADIPILVHHFLEQFNHEYPDRFARITPSAMDCLFHSEWPNNVRQLLKVVRKAAVFSDAAGDISASFLQHEIHVMNQMLQHRILNTTSFDPLYDTFHDAIRRTQKAYLVSVLSHTKGNKESAYKIAGLGKSRFYDLLKELEIK